MKTALIAILSLGLSTATGGANADPFAWRWYEVDTNNRVHLNLFVFYRDTCPHCRDGLQFADGLQRRYPWLRVWKYEISGHAGNFELYRRMAQSLNRPAGTVPAFFYCNQLTLGYTSYQYTGRQIEARLVHWQQQLQKQLDARQSHRSLHDQEASPELAARRFRRPQPPRISLASVFMAAAAVEVSPDGPPALSPEFVPHDEQPDMELPLEIPPALAEEQETVQVPLLGEQKASDLSLPAFTVIIAGCDAFNPCAFFVLLSLLSLLIHARSRGRMLLVGGIFVLFSGLFYFLFMAAWLNVFMLAGQLTLITMGAGLLAVAVALINIKDYFAYRRGISLSIPESAKPGLFERMRRLVAATNLWPMLLGTLALAAAANTYELLCTAGFPMVFTRVLTLRELPVASYYSYLVFYNLIYVIPLAAIVLAFTFTLGSRKLQQGEGRILKLLSGVMMLLLGSVILLAPGLLQSAVTAVALLLGSIGLTATIVLANRWRTGRGAQLGGRSSSARFAGRQRGLSA